MDQSRYVLVMPPSGLAGTTGGRTSALFEGHRPKAILGQTPRLNPAGTALVYSTFLGGSEGGTGGGIAVDAAGSAYVTGHTGSDDFPTTPGAFKTRLRANSNAFVTKLNPAGSALVYSTYLGGSRQDVGSGIAVDAAGAAYVVGTASSPDFPTVNAVQSVYAGPTPGGFSLGSDAFVTKLNLAGSALVYSTYLVSVQ